MNPESPSTARGLLARIGGVLLGVLLLYALGSGPATYYQTRYENTVGIEILSVLNPNESVPGDVLGSWTVCKVLWTMYRPLEAGVKGTPLEKPMADYRQRWAEGATARYPLRIRVPLDYEFRRTDR